MFNFKQKNVISFCAEECQRQKSGPMSVYHMILAWERAIEGIPPHNVDGDVWLCPEFIIELGMIVEPWVNHGGLRHIPIVINGITIGHENILKVLNDLCGAWNDLRIDAPIFYKYFEECHPFADGNGRVGAVLFNYMRSSLDYPTLPPDFWERESQGC